MVKLILEGAGPLGMLIERSDTKCMCPVCGSWNDQITVGLDEDNFVGWCPCGVVYVVDGGEGAPVVPLYDFCCSEVIDQTDWTHCDNVPHFSHNAEPMPPETIAFERYGWKLAGEEPEPTPSPVFDEDEPKANYITPERARAILDAEWWIDCYHRQQHHSIMSLEEPYTPETGGGEPG